MLAIAGATALIGVIRVSYSYYKEWKKRRSLLPAAVRNAGFWTDLKILLIERATIAAFALYLSYLLAFGVWFVGAARGWWCWPYCPL